MSLFQNISSACSEEVRSVTSIIRECYADSPLRKHCLEKALELLEEATSGDDPRGSYREYLLQDLESNRFSRSESELTIKFLIALTIDGHDQKVMNLAFSDVCDHALQSRSNDSLLVCYTSQLLKLLVESYTATEDDPAAGPDPTKSKAWLKTANEILHKIVGVLPSSYMNPRSPCLIGNGDRTTCIAFTTSIVLVNELSSHQDADAAAQLMAQLLPDIAKSPLSEDSLLVKFIVESADRLATNLPLGEPAPSSVVAMLASAFDLTRAKLGTGQLTADLGDAFLRSASALIPPWEANPYRDLVSRKVVDILDSFQGVANRPKRDEKYDRAADALAMMGLNDFAFQALVSRFDGIKSDAQRDVLIQARMTKLMAQMQERRDESRNLALNVGAKLLDLPEDVPGLSAILYETATTLLSLHDTRVLEDTCEPSPEIDLATPLFRKALSLLEDEKRLGSFSNAGLITVAKSYLSDLDDPARSPGQTRYDGLFNCITTAARLQSITERLIHDAQGGDLSMRSKAMQKSLALAGGYLSDSLVQKTDDDLFRTESMMADWIDALWSADNVDATMPDVWLEVRRTILSTVSATDRPTIFIDLVEKHLSIERSKSNPDIARLAELLAMDVSVRRSTLRSQDKLRGQQKLSLLFASHGRESMALDLYLTLPPQSDEYFYKTLFEKLSLPTLQIIYDHPQRSMSPAVLKTLQAEMTHKYVAGLTADEMLQYVSNADESDIETEADAIVPVLLKTGGDNEIRRLLRRLISSRALGTVLLEVVNQGRFDIGSEFADRLTPEDDVRRILVYLKSLKTGSQSRALFDRAFARVPHIQDVDVRRFLSARLSKAAEDKQECSLAIQFSSVALDPAQPLPDRLALVEAMRSLFGCGQDRKASAMISANGPYSANLDLLVGLATNFLEAGDMANAAPILVLVKNVAGSLPPKNAVYFARLIRAALTARDLDYAERLVAELFRDRQFASERTRQSLILERGYARSIVAKELAASGKILDAAEFLIYTSELPTNEKIRAAADLVDVAIAKGMSPSEIPQTLRSLLQKIESYDGNLIDLNEQIEALADLGDFAAARSLAIAQDSSPDRVNGLITLTEISSKQSIPVSDLFDEAMRSADRLADTSVRTELFAAIADAFWDNDFLRDQALAAAQKTVDSEKKIRDYTAEILILVNKVRPDDVEKARFARAVLDIGTDLERLGWATQTTDLRNALLSKDFLLADERVANFANSRESDISEPPSVGEIAADLSQKPSEKALKEIEDVSDESGNLPIFRLALRFARESYSRRLSADPLGQFVALRAAPILAPSIGKKYLKALTSAYNSATNGDLRKSLAIEALEVLAASHQTAASTAYFRQLALRRTRSSDTNGQILNDGAKWSRLRKLLYDRVASPVELTDNALPDLLEQVRSSAHSVFRDTVAMDEFLNSFASVLTAASESIPEQLNRIKPDEALIHYQILDDVVYAVVATRDRSELHVLTNRNFDAKALSALVATIQENIHVSIEAMKAGSETNTDYAFDFTASTELYRRLIEPLLPAIADKRRLILVPDGFLADIPFALLTTSVPDKPFDIEAYRHASWLITRFSLATTPSLAMWRTEVSDNSELRPGSFLGIGDPVLENKPVVDCDLVTEVALTRGADPDQPESVYLPGARGQIQQIADPSSLRRLGSLPQTKCELEYIGSKFTRAKLLLQDNADEGLLKKLSSTNQLVEYGVIAFATHAIEAKGANAPGLVLTPPNEATTGNDGLLTDIEIGALRIKARLVILSACSTAKGGAISEEQFSGLTSAFILAGGRNTLVSFWDVDSQASARILTRMMSVYARGTREAESLQGAMTTTLAHAKTVREAHPVYWAPFTIISTD